MVEALIQNIKDLVGNQLKEPISEAIKTITSSEDFKAQIRTVITDGIKKIMDEDKTKDAIVKPVEDNPIVTETPANAASESALENEVKPDELKGGKRIRQTRRKSKTVKSVSFFGSKKGCRKSKKGVCHTCNAKTKKACKCVASSASKMKGVCHTCNAKKCKCTPVADASTAAAPKLKGGDVSMCSGFE